MKFIYDQLKSYVVHFECIDNVNVCTIENVGSSVQASRWQKILKVTGYCKLQSMDMCLQSWAGSGLVLVGCKQEGKKLNKYWLLVIFSAAVKTLVPTDSLLVCCIGSAMCKREHQTYQIRAS